MLLCYYIVEYYIYRIALTPDIHPSIHPSDSTHTDRAQTLIVGKVALHAMSNSSSTAKYHTEASAAVDEAGPNIRCALANTPCEPPVGSAAGVSCSVADSWRGIMTGDDGGVSPVCTPFAWARGDRAAEDVNEAGSAAPAMSSLVIVAGDVLVRLLPQKHDARGERRSRKKRVKCAGTPETSPES